MSVRHLQVNRAPVLILWAAVVAGCLGFTRDDSLTMGRQRKQQPSDAVLHVDLLSRAVPMIHTPQGLRALSKDKPVEPQAVQRYLESKFAGALPDVEEAMKSLAGSMSHEELCARAYALYESFRPQIPAGIKGWGAAGDLDLAQIRGAANSAQAPRVRGRASD